MDLLIVLFFKSYWLSMCLRVRNSQKVQWRLLAYWEQSADSFHTGPAQTAYSWCQLSRLKLEFFPALSNRLLHRNLLPTNLFTGTIPAANSKIPLCSPHPRAATLFLKTEWHAWQKNIFYGEELLTTRFTLAYPTSRPTKHHQPCLLGKWQLKPHSLFLCYIQGTKVTAKQHNQTSWTQENPTSRPSYSVLKSTHIQNKLQLSWRFC